MKPRPHVDVGGRVHPVDRTATRLAEPRLETLLILLDGTWLAAFAWTFFLGRGLSIKREMRYGWAQVGDALQERYTLHNDSILPALWLEVVDRLFKDAGVKYERVSKSGEHYSIADEVYNEFAGWYDYPWD